MMRRAIFNKIHSTVGNQIGPTFDCIEHFCGDNPNRILITNLTLIAAFPAWCALGIFVNKMRK